MSELLTCVARPDFTAAEFYEALSFTEDVNCLNDYGRPALSYLTNLPEQERYVQALIIRGVELDIQVLTTPKMSYFQAYVLRPDVSIDLMKAFVKSRYTVVKHVEATGESSMHLAVKNGLSYERISILLSRGANVNVKDKNCITPLYLLLKNKFYQTREEFRDILRLLVEAGADFEVTDLNGKRMDSVFYTSWVVSSQMVELVSMYSHRLDLHEFRHGDSVLTNMIVETVNVRDGGHCEYRTEYLDVLLLHGFNIEAANEKGENALDVAAAVNNEAIFMDLVDRGMEPLMNREGRVIPILYLVRFRSLRTWQMYNNALRSLLTQGMYVFDMLISALVTYGIGRFRRRRLEFHDELDRDETCRRVMLCISLMTDHQLMEKNEHNETALFRMAETMTGLAIAGEIRDYIWREILLRSLCLPTQYDGEGNTMMEMIRFQTSDIWYEMFEKGCVVSDGYLGKVNLAYCDVRRILRKGTPDSTFLPIYIRMYNKINRSYVLDHPYVYYVYVSTLIMHSGWGSILGSNLVGRVMCSLECSIYSPPIN